MGFSGIEGSRGTWDLIGDDMRMTTDGNEVVTLAEVISGHRASLQLSLAAAESENKTELAVRLKDQLQRLNDQSSKLRQEDS